MLVGDIVTAGAGLVAQTRVTAVQASTSVTLSRLPTAAGTITPTLARSDYAVTDTAADSIKWVYDMRLTSSPRPLIHIHQRQYDEARPNNEASTPTHYSLYALGHDARVRFLPPPSAAGTAVMRYYRRIDHTASPLDVPEDYEVYVIALAKAFYLADKGGNPERIQFWSTMAEEGLAKARAAVMRNPDEVQRFVPGGTVSVWSPNDVRPYIDGW